MRPLPLPPDLPTAFTFRQARAAGVSEKQLRRADLAAPFRGVRIQDADPQTDERDKFVDPVIRAVQSLASAYALVMPPGAHLSHSTAAAHYKIPLPHRGFAQRNRWGLPFEERVLIEAAVHRPGRAPRGARIRGHETVAALDPVILVGGIPMSTPAATWASLASRLTLDELVAVGDALVRIPRIPGPDGRVLHAPLATFDDLDAVIAAGRRVGIRTLREARQLIRIGSASPQETKLRLALTTGTDLPAPTLDFDVYAAGVYLGCSEIAYPDYLVAVEYEGDQHRTERSQWVKDIDKYNAYASAGWRVVQITADHLHETGEAPRRVRDALLQAGWRPGTA
ncbi:MAG: hypothetical protein JSS74_02850 [Actinobacteria bacterium]|nr:hypothetical protein [Actinomycetota bacterium]